MPNQESGDVDVSPTITSSTTTTKPLNCTPSPITPSVLPSSLYAHIEKLALQIQRNGGNGRIVLTMMQGDVCIINQESTIILDDCHQQLL